MHGLLIPQAICKASLWAYKGLLHVNIIGSAFAGILAFIAVIIQLHKHFNKAKQNA